MHVVCFAERAFINGTSATNGVEVVGVCGGGELGYGTRVERVAAAWVGQVSSVIHIDVREVHSSRRIYDGIPKSEMGRCGVTGS